MFKLLQRNSLLKRELEVLVDQTSSLKAALFEHSSCDYSALQLWREKDARRATDSSRSGYLPDHVAFLEGGLGNVTLSCSSDTQSSSLESSIANKWKEHQKQDYLGMTTFLSGAESYLRPQELDGMEPTKRVGRQSPSSDLGISDTGTPRVVQDEPQDEGFFDESQSRISSMKDTLFKLQDTLLQCTREDLEKLRSIV